LAKYAKTHLRASVGLKKILGSLALAIKGEEGSWKGREGRRGEKGKGEDGREGEQSLYVFGVQK
jgi:hypothetical protein